MTPSDHWRSAPKPVIIRPMSGISFEKFAFHSYKSQGFRGFILKLIFPVYTWSGKAEDEELGKKGLLMVNFVTVNGKVHITDYGMLTNPQAEEVVPTTIDFILEGASDESH